MRLLFNSNSSVVHASSVAAGYQNVEAVGKPLDFGASGKTELIFALQSIIVVVE
jgi:hypothetical protein